MGNCWSSCKSPRSPVMSSPHPCGNITSLSPSTGSCPPPPHHGSTTVLSPSTGSALPPSPMDAVESIRRMCEKIEPVEQIDLLIRFVENQLDKINTQSKGESSSSSSENRLETVGYWTDVAAKTIDTISTEAEKLSKSDAVKVMGSLTLKVMKGVGDMHWVFIGLSVAAFALESYVRVGSTENECLELLLKIVDLAKDVKKYSEQLPDEKEKLCTAVGTIVEGVVICHDYLKRGTFLRFWSAKTAAAQLDKTNQQLRDVRDSLGFSVDLRLLKQATMRPERSPLELLEFQPVGIENQVEEVKKLLDMEGAESALAVVVCGFGGIGKSTLAASVVQSLYLSSTVFKFCSVTIDEKASDKTSHIIKLQKDIIYNLGGGKLYLQDADQGRIEIKKALKEKCVLLFIDNVVDKDYIQQLLPKDLSSGEQKTKLRILVTSREKNLKAELNIMCKEYDGNVLSDEASEGLLLQTIIQGEAVDDMDLDERRLISEVAAACRGVPLLLSVFGKHLRVDRDKGNYQEALHVLREGKLDVYRDEDLGSKLMFVYRKIKDVEVREAFLDICSYFHGWKWNLVADIVDSSTLEDLRRRMLVSKSGSGEVIVHDILRLMGMKEARLNRFSNYKEFSDAMEDHLDGSGNVKGISVVGDECSITITQLEAMRQSLRVLMIGDWVTLEGSPSPRAFTNLRYLRVGDITALPFNDPFKLDNLRVLVNSSKPGMNLSHLPSSLKHISHDVTDFECDQFATLPLQNLKCLKSFIVENRKSVELPEELHLPASLLDLHLDKCKNLPKDIGHLLALESLILDRSDSECLPQGYGKLQKLKHLNMDYCSKLISLSEELGMLSSLEALSMKDCGNLTALPKSLGALHSLQTLELSGCINLQLLPESFGELGIRSLELHSLVNLQELPNSFGDMPSLKDLSLRSCHSLMSLPNSFVELKMLETLKIAECTKLSVLPEDFGRLRYLKKMTVESCHLLKELPRGFGVLPALKSFKLQNCDSFVNLPTDFTELSCLEKLTLVGLPFISRIPGGCKKLKKLGYFSLESCFQLKTLPDDFENMATLEILYITDCPELDGAMMEKILNLQSCYRADIKRSRKLVEKWKQMQSEIEHPIAVISGLELEDKENKERAIRHALLHGTCMEVNSANGQLVERSSLFAGLEEGSTATVALIMLPANIGTEEHQTLKQFVEMAEEKAKSNGSGKLLIVCARKSKWTAHRATPTEEEERAEEEGNRQILLSLPKGSCAIPPCQSKRVKILSAYGHKIMMDFFIGDVVVDMEGSKRFEDLKFMREHEMRAPIISEPKIKQSPSQSKSIQNFVDSIYDQSRGESKRREFIEALKGEGIHYLHLRIDNNTAKVMVDDLDGKTIGFIIGGFSDLECIKLQHIYKELQEKDSNFIAIWIPTEWSKDYGYGTYARLIQCMPWATFPQLVNVERRGYPCRFVVLDDQGQIAERDALPLLLAWGVESYPFTRHTIPESLWLMESESFLEFLLHGMNIVGRKSMKSKMTFLFAYHPWEWHGMKCQLEQLTQRFHGNFEVLYVGKFEGSSMYGLEDTKQEYEDAVEYMSWPALSFSDMMIFWCRCKFLASKEGHPWNRMMETLHGLARHLKDDRPSLVRHWSSSLVHLKHNDAPLVLVENDGVVTCLGEDVVKMICESSDGEEGMVKDELILSLSRGECTPLVKTIFRDEIDNHPQHAQHRISYSAWREHWWENFSNYYICDVCCSGKSYWRQGRSYRCEECEWMMCGSCWMAWAKQQQQ